MNQPYNLYHFLWKTADWLYPPVCAGCGKANFRFCPDCLASVNIFKGNRCPFCGNKISSSQTICDRCNDKPVYFSTAASWAEYGGVLREAIHALKYKSNIGLGDYFSRFLIDLLLEKSWNFDLVIPVPLSKERTIERSYNQAALLSHPIALYFRVGHDTKALFRIKETGSQITRSRIDRDSYLEDAFSGNSAKLKGRNVLLVDDIITTGSTINHCARALLEAGATQVKAISVAKTLKIRHNKDPMTIPFLDYPNSNGG